jgi:hypothetical protein
MSFPPQGSGSGGGGGDPFFMGWFTDPTELVATYPTAGDGDYANVVSTGTIWVWDVDALLWVDSHINAYTDGDMLKSVYDTDDTGVVDDSQRLGGQLPAYYLPTASVPVAGAGLTDAAHTFNVNVDGTTIEINGSDQLHVIGGGGSGDVTGPASAVVGNISTFASTDGKSIQDSGIPISGLVESLDDLSDVYILTPTEDDIMKFSTILNMWTNEQLEYGDVYGPDGTVTARSIVAFTNTGGRDIIGTDILVNSSNNMNLNQHTIYNGTIDGGNLDP